MTDSTVPPAAAAGSPAPAMRRSGGRAAALQSAFTAALILLGAGLLMRHLGAVDWSATRSVLAELPGDALAAAALLSALSYAVYCGFDLLGRRTTRHGLDTRRVLAIGFVVHACALSLGPAGAGVRFRLYARHGFPAHLSAALWLFNVATNWIGFLVLAGIALATGWIALPVRWDLPQAPLQAVGVALLGVVAAYGLACRFAHRRALVVRGVEFRLPPAGVALLQCLLSTANWLLLAAVVHTLLRERVPFDAVLGAVLGSALALAIVDVPAGIGVMETVFLAVLGSRVPPHEVLGALLAYRALYYLLPLALSSLVYLGLEWDAHALRRRRTRPPGGAGFTVPRSPDGRCLQPVTADVPPPPRRSP